MADDFVNNFGLLGQVLFKKRNEREARQKLDEALSRELAKIAAQAGYEKEIAEMRERGATDRTRMGEEGAEKRSKRSEDEAMARARFGAGAQMENAQIAQEGSMARQVAGDTAQLEREKAAWEREKEHRAILAEIARRNSLAQGTGAAAQFADKVGDLDPALLEGLTGFKPRAAAGPAAGPTKPGRIKLGGGTPPKPGETPRSPDNAAPEVPVKVGPKPLNSGVSIIGGDKATLQGGPEVAQPSFMELMQQAPQYARPQRSLLDTPNVGPADSVGAGLLDSIRGNTWGVGPSSKNMQALLEAYLNSAPAIKK